MIDVFKIVNEFMMEQSHLRYITIILK